MMKIQKGLVKDQGYPDVVCSYGTCDNGAIYYFIENGTLSNGNIIATTNLKEAIGHAQNTSLGLINSNGDILIPFENRILRIINNDLLLVERNNPVSQNVVDAMRDRADPLAANKLVTTAADIKDRMNAKMGRDGKFLYNNQFGEASIFDINGNRVIDEYYSYIAMDDDTIYYSKNMKDDPIFEYSIHAPIQNNNQNIDNNTLNEVSSQNNMPLNVADTGVTKEEIDKEFAKEVVVPVAIHTETVNHDSINPDTGVDSSVQSHLEVQSNEQTQDQVENKDVSFNDTSSDIDDKSSNSLNLEADINALKDTFNDFSLEKKIKDNDNKFHEEEKKKFDFSSFKKDTIINDNINSVFDNKYEPDTVIENANNVMKKLIKQNKSQKDLILDKNSKIESLENENQLLTNQCEDMGNKNEELERKVLRYEEIVKKYATKITALSEKVDSQSETIKSQQKRLDILEPQIAGRHQLGDTVEEAMEILNESDEIDHVYTKDFVA